MIPPTKGKALAKGDDEATRRAKALEYSRRQTEKRHQDKLIAEANRKAYLASEERRIRDEATKVARAKADHERREAEARRRRDRKK